LLVGVLLLAFDRKIWMARGKHNFDWEGGIKMGLTEIGREAVERFQLWAFVQLDYEFQFA
jgi:hypothetical protein